MLVVTKRIYEKPSITDGKRILVDRLWPRGVKRSTANVDLWLKAVAPSDDLRQWFNHSPKKWEDFKKKYKKELEGNKTFIELVHIIRVNDVTLLYAAKDMKHNNAVALSKFISDAAKRKSDPV
jgi:uncharacterized protein YeaO (DUF488 family)